MEAITDDVDGVLRLLCCISSDLEYEQHSEAPGVVVVVAVAILQVFSFIMPMSEKT